MATLNWGKFEWRAGAETYSFEIDSGGLHATLRAGQAPPLTLPVVAWEGLIDAIKANQRARTKSHALAPPRGGARWSDSEIDELAQGYSAGVAIGDLARRHSRTVAAIEHQLVRIGLLAESTFARARL